MFQDVGEGNPWDVIPIFSRITKDVDAQPDRIEVAFSPDDGHPVFYSVVWPESSDRHDLVLGVDGFHEITPTATEFDGEWRFTSGVIDGTQFGSPVAWGAITLTLGGRFALFPADCNQGGGIVDIYDGSFGIGRIGHTDGGCSEYSTEAELFITAIQRVENIEREASGMTLSGPGVELRFVSPEVPESLGPLPLTAAGETLLLEFPDGRSRGVTYTISSGSLEQSHHVHYVLTAEADGVDTTAGWETWAGEFKVPAIVVSGPGPDRVVIPDTIFEGDYLLCSPYWEPDPFCFDLLVRPGSAPWFVTAGADGVLLHDADGTSITLSDPSAAIAFLVGGRLVTQPGSRTDPEPRVLVDIDESSTEYPLGPGEVLLDVAVTDRGLMALVSAGSGVTSVLDLDTGDRTDIGPASSEARFHDNVVLLRPSSDRVEARSPDGELLWETAVDGETMVVPADPGIVRLDRFGDLYTEGAPAFRQYLETRLTTGEELDSYEREVAIPLDGDEITDRCLRAEMRDSLLLCPQPDGRMVTLEVEGGESAGFPAGPGVGTYVRPDD
jgi:heat shock protein HslJ